MTRFTDGSKTVEITMKVWQDGQYAPDWEKDFFEVGALPYDEETDTYTVDDVDYLIDQANDWHEGIGDYQDDLEGHPGHNPDDRYVYVTECDTRTEEDEDAAARDFVLNVMENDRDGVEEMTVAQAAGILEWMRDDDEEGLIPSDLTAELFTEIWNDIKGIRPEAATMTKTIYLVYDVPAHGTGDWFESSPTFDRARALRAASGEYAHLTDIERKKRRVYVGIHHVELPDGDARTAAQVYDDMVHEDTWPADHDVIELPEVQDNA